MTRYIIRNNSGDQLTFADPRPDIDDRYYSDLARGLAALEKLVKEYPVESSRPGGFTLEQVPVVVARYTFQHARAATIIKESE